MIRKDSTEINPYILSDETHHQVHRSHYVLGESRYRNLQDKRIESNNKIKEYAASLGVEFEIPQPDVQGILDKMEAMRIYNSNRAKYDAALEEVFAKCPPEMVIAYIDGLSKS